MASAKKSTWEDEIRVKLITTFEKTNVEGLLRVLHYLDHEDNKNGTECPAWKKLKSKLHSDASFKKYSEKLIGDTKHATKDVSFRAKIIKINSLMAEESDDDGPSESDDTSEESDDPTNVSQGLDLAIIIRSKTGIRSIFKGFARALRLISEDRQIRILKVIQRIVINQQAISCIEELTYLFDGNLGNIATVGLAAVQLGFEAIKNIYRWWKGEISGKRCCKNIVDSTFIIGAAVAGRVGGSVLGAAGGPIGIFAGGMIGQAISAKAMSILIDRLTQSLFGIPKDKSLENAYNFLKVKPTANNSEINSAFRKLCLKHHPDKGGKTEDFLTVQVHMAVIKAARGELYK